MSFEEPERLELLEALAECAQNKSDLKAIITELCDALDEIGHVTQARLPTAYWQRRKRLIEGAREATK